MTRRYQGIVGFFGLPGSGKSYSMTEFGLKCWREGRPVYSNKGYDFGLQPGREMDRCYTYSSFDELVDIRDKGACILIDELPLYFSARRWQEFPDSVLARLTQARKDGLRVAYTAIDPELCDKNIRLVTMRTFMCRSVTSRVFIRAEWGPLFRIGKEDKPRRRSFVRVKGRVTYAYDTDAKVAARPPRKGRADVERFGSGDAGAPSGVAAPVRPSTRQPVPPPKMTAPRFAPGAPSQTRPTQRTRANAANGTRTQHP